MRAEQGFDMISIATDVGILGDGMTTQLEVATGAKKEGEGRAGGGYS